jgi:radical SAM protein with 4Fe4S-binding SPASM domain
MDAILKDCIKKVDIKNKFISFFNPKTGFYVRTGILDITGKDTGEDPFMCDYPELIDVGIMGTCDHGKSGMCIAAGVGCYQNGLNKSLPNMTLEDFKTIVDQSKGKTFQYALGGRGDPNKHEQFEGILKYCRDNKIVPNYTTSGYNITDSEVAITKEYCGAVAVSWYRHEHTYKAIDKFLKAGMKTNIHYVLGQNTIEEAINRVKNDDFPKGINAVIFLLHKPVGLGSQKHVLQSDDPRVNDFFKAIDTFKTSFKVGFDSCTVPAIINRCKNVSLESIDTCEGGRYSCYCTADMKLLPCSFDQDLKWAVDLRTSSIHDAWHSDKFNSFRTHFHTACPDCPSRKSCMGGCPIKTEITLCERKVFP